MIELKEWIEDGMTIRKTNDGYTVFTVPTQHFNIKELDELTPDRFKAEVENQKHLREIESELFRLARESENENLFKDLFEQYMTPEQFVIWLKGFVEASNNYNLTPAAWQALKDELEKVKIDNA